MFSYVLITYGFDRLENITDKAYKSMCYLRCQLLTNQRTSHNRPINYISFWYMWTNFLEQIVYSWQAITYQWLIVLLSNELLYQSANWSLRFDKEHGIYFKQVPLCFTLSDNIKQSLFKCVKIGMFQIKQMNSND